MLDMIKKIIIIMKMYKGKNYLTNFQKFLERPEIFRRKFPNSQPYLCIIWRAFIMHSGNMQNNHVIMMI